MRWCAISPTGTRAYYIARTIKSLREDDPKARYQDFAVLYRTNAQSRAIEDALRRHNIPYRIWGGQSFYARKEIKDALAYMRLAVNPKDEEALLRVINYPARGIGETTLNKLIVAANHYGRSVFEVIERSIGCRSWRSSPVCGPSWMPLRR